ncbi:hypothetical protein E2562_010288 [Oryza meyeriana var. granulata]|uniref:Uncharacterized protein n=1 Tax=Oryza meyeriana var. granulata TaxID=110450 RepID=A0A6G1EJC8_9ORYZ|nr:hypothetical protein E2562_010288 [Oryza meyeriana var. granulata]
MLARSPRHCRRLHLATYRVLLAIAVVVASPSLPITFINAFPQPATTLPSPSPSLPLIITLHETPPTA